MAEKIFNRANDNYVVTASRLRTGANNTSLRLSSANNEAIIDLCNNGNIDISASTMFVNGFKVVTTSNGDATSLTALQLAQNLDVSGVIRSDGGIQIGAGIYGGTITKSSNPYEIIIDPFGIVGSNSTTQDPSWIQMGLDIDGEATLDNFGSAVSINGAGTIVAIGTQYNDGNGSTAGHVRIYQYNNNANDPSWIQMGKDIDGEKAGDKSGTSISLNDTGTIIAIGSDGNDGADITNTQRGHVRIYQYNNNANDPSWIQIGQDIDAEAVGDGFGNSVSLNALGNIVAIGGALNDGNGSNSGHVRLYQYNNNANDPSWIQMGQDIDGEAADDYSGSFVSLNAAGNIVAIGGPNNDGNGSSSGHVRLYQYNNNVNDPSWIQLGQDIDGMASNNNAARVSLNAAGTIVAVGASGANSMRGKVRIYQYNNNNVNDASWIRLGEDIDGEVVGDGFGTSISLNDTGTIVAIGGPYNDGNGTNSGHVRLYQYNNNVNDPSWIQLGRDIDGEAPQDYCQYVALNAVGNIVVIGGPYNDGNGGSAGHVRIYKYQDPASAVTNATRQVTIMGDLVVRGNTTTIYSTQVDISDILLTLASGSTNALKSNNAGIQLGTGYASLLYDSSVNVWKTNIGLDISGHLSLNGGINYSGNILPLTNSSKLPVTFNTFAVTTTNLNQDLLYGDVSANIWMDASGYITSMQIISNNSYIKIDVKVAYTASPEADQTLSFRVLRGTDNTGQNYGTTPVFSDISLGSNTGTTLNDIYKGSFYDNLNGATISNNTLYYKLQFRRDCPPNDTISRPFGIRGSTGNYFAIQELYTYPANSVSYVIDYANSTFSPVGQDLSGEPTDGQAIISYFGFSVALSQDGTIMGVTAPLNNGTGTYQGSSRIYKYNDVSWVQLGQDIDGINNGYQQIIKLSSDGTIAAISTRFISNNKGNVRIFKYRNDTSWVQLGLNIDGIATDDELGDSISLSGNGKIIAIGAAQNDTSYNNSGQAYVYSYIENDNSWNKIGTFNGIGDDAMCGRSVSLSSSGTILAISSPFDNQNPTSFGRVDIYEFSNNVWTPKGPSIYGTFPSFENIYGDNIELSSDGLTLAISERKDSENTFYGRVLVYKYSISDNSWNKIGSPIKGLIERPYETATNFGSLHIALSSDGTTMAIGGTPTPDNIDTGLVRLYKFINFDWVKIGPDLLGITIGGVFGYGLALSSDGSIMAIGSPKEGSSTDEGLSSEGYVRVYKVNYAYIT